MAVKSIFGTDPNQIPRNSDLGPMAYLRPEDIVAGYLYVRDEKASGTNGGNTIAGFTDRTLNTVVVNTIPGASLSSNQVILQAGVYEFVARAIVSNVSVSYLSLYNVSDSTEIARGENGNSSITNAKDFCDGRFTLTSQKTIKLRHYTGSVVTNGLGVAASIASIPEVYSVLIIRKVA